MDITIRREYHPILETMGLLYLRKNFPAVKADIMKNLATLNTDSASYYRENLRYLEDYVASFETRYVPAPCEELFLRYDTPFFLNVLRLMLEDPALENDMDTLPEEELQVRLARWVLPDGPLPSLRTPSERFALVYNTELTEQAKWKLLVFLEAPRTYLRALRELYRSNCPAMTYAQVQNHAVLERLLQESLQDEAVLTCKLQTAADQGPVTVYPAAVFPLSDWHLPQTLFQGVLTVKLALYRQGLSNAREALPTLLKCLGDKSKFEILRSLKERGRYNLELAEDLGLSPATVSHHMGMLLANQLVTVEKRGGKVYYQLNQAPIREMLHCLRDVLL